MINKENINTIYNVNVFKVPVELKLTILIFS